eukprot:scaffold30651_cov154-Skeletonema_menzelii.AAC.4
MAAIRCPKRDPSKARFSGSQRSELLGSLMKFRCCASSCKNYEQPWPSRGGHHLLTMTIHLGSHK